jgi:hypothetical protein
MLVTGHVRFGGFWSHLLPACTSCQVLPGLQPTGDTDPFPDWVAWDVGSYGSAGAQMGCLTQLGGWEGS